MKKIYRNLKTAVLALGCMSLLLSSCSDFLDKNPHDFVSPEIFYKNESDCMMALAGVYWTLATDHVYGERYSNILSNTDDLSYYARLNQSGQVYTNSHNSSNNDIYQTWTQLYSGINNANVLLDNIDAANIPDAAVKNRIKGEAKFLRAYYHFLLVQSWYEVPIRTETVTDINNSSLAATPHAEAIDWIIKEMEDCIDLVDDSKYDLSPSHVKKTTVQGILARVCLWRAGSPSNGGKEFYEKAAKYAKAVYDSHKHKLYLGDIYAIWKNIASDKYDTEYNESMWEVEFIGTRVDGKFTYSRIGNTIGNWQENTSSTGKGYAYGFYCGSLILWDLFEKNPGDLRRDLSMATYKLDASDAAVYWKDTEIVTRRCGKYRREWTTTSPKEKNNDQINYPVLRYADVLLMLAEAENEAGKAPTDLAYDAINEVRERAGIDKVENLSYAEFQQEVRDERARELCFESLRKYDLIRWGIYYDAAHNKLTEATNDKRWTTSGYYKAAKEYAANTEERHQFLPIPMKELGVNLLLKQNSYWSNAAE